MHGAKENLCKTTVATYMLAFSPLVSDHFSTAMGMAVTVCAGLFIAAKVRCSGLRGLVWGG